MPDAQTSIVVTDANILINLMHVQYLISWLQRYGRGCSPFRKQTT